MTDAPGIRIPADLLPGDGRFGSGPSKVRPETLAALAATGSSLLGTSHRQAPVRDLVRRVRTGVAELLSVPEGFRVVLGNGGSTAFWDVAAFCLLRERVQHVVFGEFSSKFAAVTSGAPFLADPTVIRSDPGTHPLPRAETGIDAYALTHNETSTGVTMPLLRPVGADNDALVLVDATSGAGALPVDLTQVDAYYFAPQKVLGSDGGLWIAVLSPAAVARVGELARTTRWVPPFLDLGAAMAAAEKDETVNTPALATLFLLADQLDWINGQGGLEWSVDRVRRSSDHLYTWAEKSSFAEPFVGVPAQRSPVIGTIDLDASVPAATVSAVLRAHGIVDTDSYRRLGRNQLRIGMFPAVEPADVEALTACIDHVVDAL